MKTSKDDRHSQLLSSAHAVAALATNRNITPVHVSKVEADHEIRRVLETIVRRWSIGIKPTYASELTRTARRGEFDRDHIVPCRVLVDRMIMAPDRCEEILQHGIELARVTKAEHQALGGIYTHHSGLYERMLKASPEELVPLGLERYRSQHIALHPL